MAVSENVITNNTENSAVLPSLCEVVFERRFNIGLTLDTSLGEFKSFLESHGKYIHSFFFSPPLGPAFQTRNIVDRQFRSASKEKLFWDMLALARSHGIKLEVLFNSVNLHDEDIEETGRLFEEHGISPDCVCFMEKYSSAVYKTFKGKEYVLSFNNGHVTPKNFDELIERINIDTVVLGGESIRDNALFSHIKSKGKKIILLLNNGCSFHCMTCNNGAALCKKVFDENRKKHSVEYLYALQSIFPSEIRDGTVDESLIDLFKISNRSSNISFTKGAMDSYITGNVKKYLRFNKTHYAYWGRLGHFWKHFPFMRLKKIVAYKEEILGHKIDVR